MISIDDIYPIGVLNRPHGLEGELQFTFTDDIFDRIDADYLIVLREGIPVPFFIEEYRFRSDNSALIRLEGVDSQAKAATFTNATVYFPRSLAQQHPQAEPDSWQYFVGFRVVDEQQGDLGTVEHVDDTTSNVLFEVHRGTESFLFPAHEEFITEVDAPHRVLHTCLPEGLIDLNHAPSDEDE